MSEFSRSRLLANITYLTKEKNIKIGDLEAEAGVSTGYFSRLNKGDSTALPNIEVLTAVAEKLGATIDSLVKIEYESLTESERYLVDFLEKLISDTESSEVCWTKETTRSMGPVITEDGDLSNPFFRYDDVCTGIDYNTGYPQYNEELVFNSLFYSDKIARLTKDTAYHTDLNGNTFWLCPVSIEIGKGEKQDDLEIYMKSGRIVHPVCHSNPHCAAINELLQTLYLAVIASSKRPKVNATVKAAIDLYMKEIPF